jgi:O-antigen/teichoic acid export membrane protein
LCQGLERYDYMAFSQIATAGLTLFGLVFFVRGPTDAFAVPVVMLGGQVIVSAITLLVLVSNGLLRLASVRPRVALTALRTSLALGVAPIIITVLHNSNTLILQGYRGSEAVGLFTSGYRLVEILAIVPTLITSLYFPRLSRTHPATAEWTAAMRPFISLTMSLGFFPATLMTLEAASLTQAVFGSDYDAAAIVVRVMGIAVLFNFAAIAYLMAILSAHQDRQYIFAIGVTALISVCGGLLLVPRLGAIGATLTVSGLDFITWLLTLPTIKRLSGALFLDAWRRPALACLAASVVLIIGASLGIPFLLRAMISATAYSAFILLGPPTERAEWLRQ